MATTALADTTRQAVTNFLRKLAALVPNPNPKSNLGTMLHELYVWQELTSMAGNELELAWAKAQNKDGGICDEDDRLRKGDVGESEICNSKHYALVIGIKTPAQRVDGAEFYKALAKRFKTTTDEIQRIADKCKVDNKPALTKKVVERV